MFGIIVVLLCALAALRALVVGNRAVAGFSGRRGRGSLSGLLGKEGV
ncbi:hypothetical protein FACS1894154_09640 [Betaproteobacteria bacterium]|nr:hypothetical protein FACS1894154_09640 [Betaproteobacteria bacterium]